MPTPAQRPTAVLLLRPVGYLVVLMVWLVLLAATLAILVGPFYAIDAGFGAEGGLAFALECLVIVAICSPILGPAVGFLLAVSVSSAGLAALAFARSLQPRHSGQRVTLSVWSRSTVGPANRVGPSSVSLLPTTPSPVGRRLGLLSLSGMHAPKRMVLAATWFAAAWFVTLGAVRWTLTGVGLVIGIAAVVALLALGVREARRAYRPNASGSERDGTDARRLQRRLEQARRRSTAGR